MSGLQEMAGGSSAERGGEGVFETPYTYTELRTTPGMLGSPEQTLLEGDGGKGFRGGVGADVLVVIVPHGGARIGVAKVALHVVKRRPGRQRMSRGRVT